MTTQQISADPRTPIVMPDGEKIIQTPPTPKKERKKRSPNKPKKDKKETRLKATRHNYNTPYCFNDDLLDTTGRLILDAMHISWVDIVDGGYRINVQIGDTVYARYTPKSTQLHFVYWMAYDWLLKSKQPDFEVMVKSFDFVQQDYKQRTYTDFEV